MPEPTPRLDYLVPTPDAARKKMVRRVIVWVFFLLATLIVGVILVVASFIGYFLYVQSANMAKADAHIPLIEAKIAGDARFANVTFMHFTAANGCLLVEGTVSTQVDLDALHKIVQSTSPPVYVYWGVMVCPPAQSQPTFASPPTPPTTSEAPKPIK